jgi:magnesium transporter
MISKYKYKKLTWIDLESPNREEVLEIAERYDLPALVGDELLRKTIRSKVDMYPNVIYLILHFPAVGHKHGTSPHTEIDFIIGKDFIITAHYELVDTLHEFAKAFEVNSILQKTEIGNHAGFLFFHIIKNLYRQSARDLEEINVALEKTEHKIFEGKEKEMVSEISKINRSLLDFKQAIRFHKEVLASFEIAAKKFFGEAFGYNLSILSGEYNKVQNMLESHKEILDDLRDTNDSLLTDKTNETMRTLTIMSFVIFPLTLIATLFSMDTVHTPLVGMKGDFWLVLAIMVVAVVCMYMYFKRKKWL